MMAKRATVHKTWGLFLTRVCHGTGYFWLHIKGGEDLDLTHHGWQLQIAQVIYISPQSNAEAIPIGGKACLHSQGRRSCRSGKGADVRL